MTGIAGLNGNPAYPPMPPRQTGPIRLGKVGNKLAEGFEKLGWHWWPAESTVNSAPYDGRPACTYGGPCITGSSLVQLRCAIRYLVTVLLRRFGRLLRRDHFHQRDRLSKRSMQKASLSVGTTSPSPNTMARLPSNVKSSGKTAGARSASRPLADSAGPMRARSARRSGAAVLHNRGRRSHRWQRSVFHNAPLAVELSF